MSASVSYFLKAYANSDAIQGTSSTLAKRVRGAAIGIGVLVNWSHLGCTTFGNWRGRSYQRIVVFRCNTFRSRWSHQERIEGHD